MKGSTALTTVILLGTANFLVHASPRTTLTDAPLKRVVQSCPYQAGVPDDLNLSSRLIREIGDSVGSVGGGGDVIALTPPNCVEDCDYTNETNQNWCEQTGDCEDGIWWHDNKERERTKRIYSCPAGTYVKCSAPWIDSGCCGSADSSVPLCSSPGEHNCLGSAP